MGIAGTEIAGPHLVLTVAGPVTAGHTVTASLSVLDVFNNPVLGYTGTETFGDSDAPAVAAGQGPPLSHTFTAADNGAFSFPVTFLTSGPQTLSVAGSDGLTASASLTVNAGAATQFSVNGQPAVVGTATPITVTAYDAYGNVVTGFTGAVTLSPVNGAAASPITYNYAAADLGMHVYSVTFSQPGGQKLVATSGSLAGDGSVVVSPGAYSLSKSIVSATPNAVLPGGQVAVTLTVRDGLGNQETSGGLTVAFDLVAGTTSGGNFGTTLDNGDGTYTTILTAAAIAGLDNISATIDGIAVTSSPAAVTVGKSAPAITWSAPANIAYGTALSSTQLDATASVAGTFVYTPAAGVVLGVGNNQILSVSFTPTDTTDFTTASATVRINVIAVAGASAKFVKQDTTTKGSWIGTYGAQGYDLVGGPSSLPSYATLTPTGQATYTWTTTSTDTRGLQVPGSSNRLAAAWYSGTTFSAALNLTDGNAHNVELYIVDWDSKGRSEQVQITTTSGTVLDTESISSFGGGEYLDWTITGNVVIKIINNSGSPNALLNGLFIDATATATAKFLKQDTTTAGSWIGTYGAQGYDVVGGPSSLPPYATLTPTGQTTYIWTTTSTDTRGLQVPGSSNRVAAAWYASTSFSAALNLTDGNAHDIELYFVDWDSKGRSEQVQITTTSGTVLDTESISSFGGGEYLDWTITGNVVIKIINNTGSPNALLNGLFIDPTSAPKAPTINWTNPANIVYGTALSSSQLDATASVPGTFAYAPASGTVLKAGNGQTLSVTFTPTDRTDYTTATATALINVLQATPTINWTNPANIISGTALTSTQLDATASVSGTLTYAPPAGTVLGVGNNQPLKVSFAPTDSTDYTSATATVSINVIGLGSSAKFLKQDTTTKGSWIGTYGAQGYDLVGGPSSLPSYATLTPTGQATYTWTTTSTDTRGLQVPGSSNRLAAAWYSGTSFSAALNLTDGNAHNVELYFVDWDSKGRSEQVQITTTSGTMLDTESISSFGGGEYLDWTITGNVVIKIINNTGSPNALLNGLFIDATATATAKFLEQDTTTAGSWIGTYGAQGYDVVGGPSSLPSYATVTPAGQTTYIWTTTSTDTRGLQVPGSSNRVAAAWYASTSFSAALNLTDGNAHNVELYFVDWDSKGRSEQVQITTTTGTVLDTESISSFGGGEYLDWTITGNVVIKITNNAGSPNALLNGLFIDATATATAKFLKQDTTTAGSWIGNYGAQGYDVVGGPSSLPSYATVTPAGQTTYIWTTTSTDTRGLQVPGSSNRIAAAWYASTSFTVAVNLTDGAAHNVELYFVDWDSKGRSEQVQISSTSGTVLDIEKLSTFSGGEYLDWTISGDVVITITNTGAPNALLNGLFIDAALSDAFVLQVAAVRIGGSTRATSIPPGLSVSSDLITASSASTGEPQTMSTTVGESVERSTAGWAGSAAAGLVAAALGAMNDDVDGSAPSASLNLHELATQQVSELGWARRMIRRWRL